MGTTFTDCYLLLVDNVAPFACNFKIVKRT